MKKKPRKAYRCRKCGSRKHYSYVDGKGKFVRLCKKCSSKRARKRYLANPQLFHARVTAYRKANPEKRKKYNRQMVLSRRGLTELDYVNLFVKQNRRCAICMRRTSGDVRTKHMHIDHDHKTGKVRGLLCKSCNNALGLFGDDISLLKAAIKYLRRGGCE
jgi:hypothetical protein